MFDFILQIEPSWRCTEYSVVNKYPFQYDGSSSTHAMNTKVNSPKEVTGTFDAIAYEKSKIIKKHFSF